MHESYYILLKSLRRLYSYVFGHHYDIRRDCKGIVTDPDKASGIIYDTLMSDKPCMIARYGSTELYNTVNYRSMISPHHSMLKYISDKEIQWWRNESNAHHMCEWSGFFPNTEANMRRFAELICRDSACLDVLGSWCEEERFMDDLIPEDTHRIFLPCLEPMWAKEPWTRALKGRKVLVVHPFAELIKFQYDLHRDKLFASPDILPEFSLSVLKAVQSLGGDNSDFQNWFEALEWMKDEIDKSDFDICLIGCGAYGFPLAAHVKRQGRKAIHMGGALQLLFGIKGNRWENTMYGVKEWGLKEGQYKSLFNEYWVRPGDTLRPKNAQKVEGACYW